MAKSFEDQCIEVVQAKVNKAYDEGYNEGLTGFAWWKDGVQFVGTSGTKLKDVLRKVRKG